LSNDFVYYFTNRGVFISMSVNDSFVFRLPLDPLSIGAGFGFGSVDFGANGFGNLSWRCATGAHDVVYFAAHNNTSQIRIFDWPENSGSESANDVNLSAAWPNVLPHVCPTPDSRDWCGFDDGRIKSGWVGRNMIGFMWNVPAGGSFVLPYVEAVRVAEPTRAHIDRPFIFNCSIAFQYPAAAPNRRGDVRSVVHDSTAPTEPFFYVGIDDDYSHDGGHEPPG
jgi:hypothetical protein